MNLSISQLTYYKSTINHNIVLIKSTFLDVESSNWPIVSYHSQGHLLCSFLPTPALHQSFGSTLAQSIFSKKHKA